MGANPGGVEALSRLREVQSMQEWTPNDAIAGLSLDEDREVTGAARSGEYCVVAELIVPLGSAPVGAVFSFLES